MSACVVLLLAELVLLDHQALFITLDLIVQAVERALHIRHAFNQLVALLDQDGLARICPAEAPPPARPAPAEAPAARRP